MENKDNNISNNISIIRILSKLFKLKISFFVGLSACFGYMIAGGFPDLCMITIFFGTFFLACGACGLNEFQEQKQDAIMDRTKKRPLPNGNIRSFQAIIISIIALMLGSILFIGIRAYIPLLIGLSAVIWYNLIYTPLKKKTAFAVLPGAFVGVAGPSIGWLSAGGDLLDIKLAIICSFFFIWQLPHFILLMVLYEKEYRKAGFPVITDILSMRVIQKINNIWLTAMVSTCLLIPYINGFGGRFTLLTIFLLGIVLIWRMKRISFTQPAIIELNFYVLITSILLCIDKLIPI